MLYTFLGLGLYFVIAALPKVPWYAKVLAQLGLGAAIYFGCKEVEFGLPMADKLPMSSLFGGDAFDIGNGWNKFAFGILGTVLGLLATLFFSVIYFVLGKKKSDAA